MNSAIQVKETTLIKECDYNKFFNSLINDVVSTIKSHQLMLNTGMLDDAKVRLYDNLRKGRFDEIKNEAYNRYQEEFLQKVLIDYIFEVNALEKKPDKLLINVTKHSIMVWGIIDFEDEDLENSLYLKEAEINARNTKLGINVMTKIAYKEDHLDIPKEYIEIEF